MKPLIIYYSRTKTTKKVAESISSQLNCDIEEIIDLKSRKGPIGYIIAGKEAMRKELPKIKVPTNNPQQYDITIIGTPVWGWTISSPIRTYLTRNKDNFKKVAFFCTQGSSGAESTFKEMEKISRKKPLATLKLTTIEVKNNDYDDKINKFIESIKK